MRLDAYMDVFFTDAQVVALKTYAWSRVFLDFLDVLQPLWLFHRTTRGFQGDPREICKHFRVELKKKTNIADN